MPNQKSQSSSLLKGIRSYSIHFYPYKVIFYQIILVLVDTTPLKMPSCNIMLSKVHLPQPVYSSLYHTHTDIKFNLVCGL